MNYRLLFSLLLLAGAFPLSAQLTLVLNGLPAATPTGATIYAAGSFNGWDPADPGSAFAAGEEGKLWLDLSLSPGPIAFKLTRGSWDTVEGNAQGGFLPNRTYGYTGGTDTLYLDILSWEGQAGSSTASPNVALLDEAFWMPQLGRARRIWVYLPPDYETSDKDYPVLYMQDGQNLFDAATAAFGEWEVDEALDHLFGEGDGGIIVVGIDHGGSQRLDEYSPWANPQYGGGEGAAYAAFIVETLKPYIDANYRTLSGREHTGIMGSSMGGLISLFAAAEYQEVFSKAGIFSASYWFSSECYAHVLASGKTADMKFYLLAGGMEGGNQVGDMEAMYNTLMEAGFGAEEIEMRTVPEGGHNEALWRGAFPEAYLWLFSAAPVAVPDWGESVGLKVFPNPGQGGFTVSGLQGVADITVWDQQDRRVASQTINAQQARLDGLMPGIYWIVLESEQWGCSQRMLWISQN
ncbi:alpha/beta hydrolase-fold protein [Phaeodactylibacter luteus]|uniref:T9SS type A sorting domain-containing protein n=1 Tax=Phaeodactylibacter luteus TaxID=1564516 RepID=A0A5C6S9L1_9BACT|nr:alpha/beta hydrolase-fold protein [Phaeodactylibacter luteus]TXB70264.1 hypothetical protein FRY97_00745 [Phaeodactylibacter luteus]